MLFCFILLENFDLKGKEVYVEAFKTLDKNNDGNISKIELLEGFLKFQLIFFFKKSIKT